MENYTLNRVSFIQSLIGEQYKTRQQNDFSVYGSEFVNTISTIATCRIIRKAEQNGLLDHMTYAELMDDLSSAWRKTNAPREAVSNDAYWVHTLQFVFEELEALGLSAPILKQHKKRGRKPKIHISINA